MTSKTIPLRLEEDLVQRLDSLADALSKRTVGVKVTRSAAMRAALERGLDSLEAEVGKPARRPKPKR
jgi:predicted transcriptional regulator